MIALVDSSSFPHLYVCLKRPRQRGLWSLLCCPAVRWTTLPSVNRDLGKVLSRSDSLHFPEWIHHPHLKRWGCLFPCTVPSWTGTPRDLVFLVALWVAPHDHPC